MLAGSLSRAAAGLYGAGADLPLAALIYRALDQLVPVWVVYRQGKN